MNNEQLISDHVDSSIVDPILIQAKCVCCGTRHHTHAPVDKLLQYLTSDELIQNVFSPLEYDDDYREIVIAQRTQAYICPNCWGEDQDS